MPTCRSLPKPWLSPHQGRKVFTLHALPQVAESFDVGAGKVAEFSLHAGIWARTGQRQKLERPCRYISRPGVSETLHPSEHRAAVSWAQRLKRVFRIIACIEDLDAIDKILAHLDVQSA